MNNCSIQPFSEHFHIFQAGPSQLASASNDIVHNRLITVPGTRVSKIKSNGNACIFAVSENANESIGAAGFSDRRNAHKTYAVLIKMDLFATCNPGQILCVATSCMHRLYVNGCLTYDQSQTCRNLGHPALFRLQSANAEDRTFRDQERPRDRWRSP